AALPETVDVPAASGDPVAGPTDESAAPPADVVVAQADDTSASPAETTVAQADEVDVTPVDVAAAPVDDSPVPSADAVLVQADVITLVDSPEMIDQPLADDVTAPLVTEVQVVAALPADVLSPDGQAVDVVATDEQLVALPQADQPAADVQLVTAEPAGDGLAAQAAQDDATTPRVADPAEASALPEQLADTRVIDQVFKDTDWSATL